jgi:LL-diaminopimelate aminotransferase
MARINDYYLNLAAGYLFPEIERRTKAFQAREPRVELIRLGIGDVVLPLPESVRDAMHRAVDELGTEEGFHGYGPYEGYDFLREAIAEHDFRARGAEIGPDEIFVSDGSKCDSANIQEIFAGEARIAVPDPTYPVYVDTNVMAGRGGKADARGQYQGIVYLPCTEENGFQPVPPSEPVDLVYLCSPNNPTGSAAGRDALAAWVDYARETGAVLLYDAAYEAYITEEGLPHSIFEIPGAREVAIEFRSYSKSAGFTGVRCGFVALPRDVRGTDASGNAVDLHSLWSRRHSTKFNGASYPVQVGAAATYTEQGRAEVRANVGYYLDNAKVVREGLTAAGLEVFGGINAPYVWVRTPDGLGSWEFFDRLLERAHVVCTPGAGFGPHGEGFIRISAFGKREQIAAAVERIRSLQTAS